jgi:hypothetical protein
MRRNKPEAVDEQLTRSREPELPCPGKRAGLEQGYMSGTPMRRREVIRMSEIIVTLAVFGLLWFLLRKGGTGCCGGHSHGDRSGSKGHDTREKNHTGKTCH